MLASAIILIIVALASGYIGARIERKRSSSITKREATQLRRDVDEIKAMFGEHWNTHKIIKYHIESLNRNMGAIGQVVGMEQSDQSRSVH